MYKYRTSQGKPAPDLKRHAAAADAGCRTVWRKVRRPHNTGIVETIADRLAVMRAGLTEE